MTPAILARAAAATYQPKPAWCHHVIDLGDLRADIYRHGDQGYLIAIRGTNNLTNWRTNFDIQFTHSEWLRGNVHRGFAEASQRINHELRTWLVKTVDMDRTSLWLCGHSLGGAIATYLAPSMADFGANVRTVTTYGSPRVGDRQYVSEWNKRFAAVSHRIVNSIDPVPHMPPWATGYRHVAGLDYHDRNGVSHGNDMRSVWADHLTTIGRPSLRHDMANYLGLTT
jgi:predicted lipase